MPLSHARRARALLAAVVGAAACAGSAHALESITLDAARTAGAGWSARGVNVRLGVGADAATVELTVDELALPGPVGVLRSLRARCDALRAAAGAYECAAASAVLDSRHRTRSELRGRFTFTPAAHALDADVSLLGADGAPLRLRATLAGGRWTVDVDTAGYAVAALAPWLADLIDWSPTAAPAGALALEAHAELRDGAVTTLRARARLDALTFAAFEDRLATEALDGEIEIDAQATAAGALSVALRLRGSDGQAYADPWFIDAGKQPFTLHGAGSLALAQRSLTLDTLHVDQPGVLRASGRAVLVPYTFRVLDLQLDEAHMPGAYTAYLQPLLIGTVLDELDTQGSVSGRVEMADGELARLDLALDDLHAEDRNGRFAVYGVSGDLRWAEQAEPAPASDLRYDGAALYGIPFDAGRVRLASVGASLQVLDTPLRAPLLGGALVVRTLGLRGLGTDDIEADFDAVLEPIDVARLTSALGWVPFAGTLSGRLPTLRYADGVLTLGGALEAEVFDGRISIDGVRIEQPLGVVPALHADVRMRDIDLERLTSTFSFGHITGRLHADVLGLEVIDWRAERFDARLYTPLADDSRHRISQRAVNSIAALGGGVTASLQKGFMRLFDEFSYDRIDLSCRMRDQVCAMGGVDAAGDGYYILRGEGLPRLDVIGYERAVSWPAFAAGLLHAARSGDVVIE